MLCDPELIQRPLGDGAVFDVLGRWYHRDPPEPLLWEAAELYEGASPAMIQGAARWLGVMHELTEAGLDAGTVARVLLSAAAGKPPGWVPPGPVLSRAITRAGAQIDGAAVAAELLGDDDVPHKVRGLLTICTASMARAGIEIPESHDASLVLNVPWADLRAVLEALPPSRRDAVLVRLIGRPSNANAARVQLRNVLPVLDLAAGDEVLAAIAAARKHLEGSERWAELLTRVDAGGGPPAPRDGPTDECRKAVEYWLAKYAAKRRVESIGEVAQQIHGRAARVDAPELASPKVWSAATDERREAIARQLAEQVEGLAFTGMEAFDTGALATFSYDAMVFRLVPGGSYDRGFSPEEEALVRSVAEAKRAEGDNWFEEFGNFLDNQLHSMRPVARVTVGPLLVCASPGYAMAPDTVVEFLQQSPWRLPSESEWEYLARGGREHELTWRGHTVPDDAWFREASAAGDSAYNAFGLWGFGMQPELCADGWQETYEGAPTDGSPRWADGTRVTRGGAAMLYPWQQVGEWQLLCSAVRSPAVHWEFELSVRPVLGISVEA